METAINAQPSGDTVSSFGVRRVAQLVCGGLGSIAALALLAAAGALVWGIQTHRDGHGYFTTATHRYQTSTYGLVTESLDVNSRSGMGMFVDRLRLEATPVKTDKPLFIGIARTRDINGYLGRVEHDWVGNISIDPFKVDYRRSGTTAPAGPPSAQRFWVVRSSGTGRQTISWPITKGQWSAVAMNTDGTRAVSADVQIAASVSHVWWYVIGLVALGALALAGGVALLYRGIRRRMPAS